MTTILKKPLERELAGISKAGFTTVVELHPDGCIVVKEIPKGKGAKGRKGRLQVFTVEDLLSGTAAPEPEKAKATGSPTVEKQVRAGVSKILSELAVTVPDESVRDFKTWAKWTLYNKIHRVFGFEFGPSDKPKPIDGPIS